MQWCQRKNSVINSIVRRSISIFAAIASYAYFIHVSSGFSSQDALTAGQLTSTVKWLAWAVAVIFIACRFATFLTRTIDRSLNRFGKFQAIEITKGDLNRQSKLMAKNARSFWKFIISGTVAVIWNIAGGILTAVLLKSIL